MRARPVQLSLLRERVNEPPYRALIRGVDPRDNVALLEIAWALGRPIARAGPGVEDGVVRTVRVRQPEGLTPAQAAVFNDDTAEHKVAHTDASGRDTPPDAIVLACCSAAVSGGQAFFLTREDIEERLSNGDRTTLSQAIFPMGNEDRPVLGPDRIRYHGPEIRLNLREAQRALAPEAAGALDRLDAISSDASVVSWMDMTPGDVVVFSNRSVLHGRTAFRPAASRLLKHVYVELE